MTKGLTGLFRRDHPSELPAESPPSPIFQYGAAGAMMRLVPTQSTVGTLQPGWSVARTIMAFSPLVLLELRPVDPAARSHRAYWCLDRRGHFLANTVEPLPDELVARVRDVVLTAVASRDGGDEAVDPVTRELLSLDPDFALDLLRRLFSTSTVSPLCLAQHPLTPDRDGGVRLRIETGRGPVALVVDDAIRLPILIQGRLLQQFEPGWHPRAVITLFLPLLVVELEHDDGRRASWVLDERLDRVDDEGFPRPETVARLRAVAPALLRRYWNRVLDLTEADLDPALDPLLGMNDAARWNIFRLCRDLVFPHAEEILLKHVREPLVLPACRGQERDVVLQPDTLARAVQHDLYGAGVEAIRTGRFTWPSPVDGSEAPLEAVFVPQEYTIFYQFRDRNGLRFLVATGERRAHLIGLLIPSANIVIGDTHWPNQWFIGLVGTDIWSVLVGHCVALHPVLAGRRRRADSPIVNVFMGPPLLHIGHYVWNDLSGQAALVEDVPDRLPRSVILGAPEGQAEFFGRLGALFPALAGQVDHRLANREALTRHVYGSDDVPIRFTKDHVSRALRERVRRVVEASAAAAAIARQAASCGPGPVIIVGIRLEDRTFVDPNTFYMGLVEHVVRRHPHAVLVFDGRNAKPGGSPGETIAGMTDGIATRPPVDAERDLVETLRAAFQNQPVAILDTIGQPIEASLGWCYRAQACVAVWGAGLAKYRWLANLPSLILTSRHNIEHRDDLDIYHAPRWMEAPSPVLYPDPDQVVDHLDKVGLATSRIRIGRECFEMNLHHACRLLDRLLKETVPAGQPSA